MGFIRGLLSRKDSPGVKRIPGGLEVSATLSEGDFRLDVVGESHYQDALESIAGGRSEDGANHPTVALLVPEPNNRYDHNAVGVWIDGKQVGYLSRDNAEILQPCILKAISTTHRQVACNARVVGGWDRGGRDRGHFGVRLYVDLSDFDVDADDLDGDWEEPDRGNGRSGRSAPRTGPGTLDGRHYTECADDVRNLRRDGKDEEAERLLLRLVDATEEEAKAQKWGVAPWYYEQLAIIYRKRKDLDAEVRILERFARQPHAPGATPPKLLERLQKARLLRSSK